MTFFNKKEDVLDIQLTQFGKALLARGIFKPVYYAFFDDDILYDPEYGGFTEAQNDTAGRIKDTVRTHTQHLYYGVETEFRNANRKINRLVGSAPFEQLQALLLEPMQPVKDKYYSLTSPLGNSVSGQRKAPQWEVNMISSEMTGAVNYDILTISKVPQLKILSGWTSSFGYNNYAGQAELTPSEITIDGGTLSKGDISAYLKMRKNHIIIEIHERNAELLQRDNYEIEVFKVKNEPSVDLGRNVLLGTSSLEPLRFKNTPQQSLVVNNILQDPPPEIDSGYIDGSSLDDLEDLLNLNVDPSHVEYYIDILTDEEIDPQILCRSIINSDRRIDIFSDLQTICTEEVVNSIRPNIYRPSEYEDPCDE